MNSKEIETLLKNSGKDDWIINDEDGVYTYKNDVNLHIQRSSENRDFNEPWAVKFPDKNAKASDYTIYYNNSLIEKKTLVSVDGGRAVLPMPKSNSNNIVDFVSYILAKIVNAGDQFDSYFNRALLKKDDKEKD